MPETPVAAPARRPGDSPETRRAVLIVNTKARRGQEWLEAAQESLRAQNVPLEAVHALHDPGDLEGAIRDSLRQGANLVIVGGGDGSLRTAAGLLAYQDATLGALPLGTVNDFARNLEIEPEVEAACRVIAEGHVRQIDLGMANDAYFLITASLGFSARTQQALTPHLKKRLGPLGYVTASLLALNGLRKLRLTVACAEAEECLRVVQAGVINAHSWMGGAFEIPGVSLESGQLAFYAIPPLSLRELWQLYRALQRRRFFRARQMRAFTTRDITFETPTPRPLVLDGDLCGQTPARLRVAPAALRVCVPAPKPSAASDA